MGTNHKRSMGIKHYSRWIQTGICSQTTLFRHKRNKGQNKRQNFNRYRNSRTSEQECDRNCPKTQNSDRFLQYIISGSKEKWRNETCHQSKTPQQVSAEETFQNGHYEKSFESSSKRRLEHKSRSKRCLFSHRDSQGASSVSPFLLQISSLPVQSTLFRSDSSSSSIYQSHSSSSILSSKTECSVSYISRRLVDSKQNKVSTFTRPGKTSKSPLRTRFHCKQKEIESRTSANYDLHRRSVLSKRRNSISHTRQTGESEISCKKHIKRSKFSKGLLSSLGQDSIMHRSDTKCKTVYEANSAPSVGKLESQKNVTYTSNTIYSFTKFSSSLVVTGSEHSKGSLFSADSVRCCSDNRCKQHMGLGWPYRQPYSARPLVSTAATPTHQLFGDGGSDTVSETFSTLLERQKCSDTIRQHHCSPVYQQAGGYKISQSLPSDLESMDVSIAEQYEPEGSPHCRESKYTGRLFKQTVSQGNRVVCEQISCVQNIPSLGLSTNGFVCDNGEQKDTTVLYMDPSSSGLCIGCPVNCMAEHVCVCVPTSKTNSEGTVSHATVQLHSDSDSSKLVKTALVSAAAADVDSQPIETSIAVRPSVTGKGTDITSRPSVTRSDCMAHINKRLAAEGFSEKARTLLTSSWRKGTQKDYRSKFRLFCNWCSEQQIDPFTASLKDCVNFLTYKFHQGAAYRTIAGYRSMMSSVLPHVDKFPVGQHPYVIRLLKGVYNERPPVKKLVPEWDLPLVLGTLKKAPFEPLREASLKHLTWKTCFLIAITSFRRCSDLQSLKLGEGSVNVQKKGITFIRQGLSKQDRPGHKPTPVFIPCFPDNKKLDPKRCLAMYLKRTEQFRKKAGSDITQLFLATISPHQPVTAQTISKWIVKTIKFAYKESNKSVVKVKGHSTRSVGPSWALFKGVSMKDVMESADWSRETTFVKHYLTAVNVDFLTE